MKLSTYAQGRDNNFNLIRIIAALSVLITHSFALATGHPEAEPLRQSLGITMGTMAVDLFFLTSGFLVTNSLLVRQSVLEFTWARVLRIFPALWVMLLLTVFIVGPQFSTIPTSAYLKSHETYTYLAKCGTLISGVAYELPGVFATTPYQHAVNGSLWTMPYEVRMYAVLAMTWLVLGFARTRRVLLLQNTVVLFALLGGVGFIYEHIHGGDANHLPRLFFMFFLGGAFCVFKERIVLSRWVLLLFITLLATSVLNKQTFFYVYAFVISYVLFYLAYVPGGVVRQYNKLGDYSYGVYIYAFPIQQICAALMPGIGVFQMILLSMFFTLLLSILSWHLLEKRALGLKNDWVGRTRRVLKMA